MKRALILIALLLALAGCGFAPQPPGAPPATGAPKKVMLVGDSLLMYAGPAIQERFNVAGIPATVSNHAISGWGFLTHAEGLNLLPSEAVGTWITQENPDIVVVEFSGNYWDPQDGPSDYLSPAFFDRWRAQADAFTNTVLAAGKKLYWVIPPPRSSNEVAWFWFHDLAIQEAQAHPGVGVIDWWTATTTSDGHWAVWLDSGAGYEQVRVLDGLHLTPAGTNRVAAWTVAALRGEWG